VGSLQKLTSLQILTKSESKITENGEKQLQSVLPNVRFTEQT
jgi:hypothetical protein